MAILFATHTLIGAQAEAHGNSNLPTTINQKVGNINIGATWRGKKPSSARRDLH
jgi:hypothetical protein